MKRTTSVLFGISCLALVACSSAGSTVNPGDNTSLGMRQMPDVAVSVRKQGPLKAGQMATFMVTIGNPQAVAGVEVFTGNDWDEPNPATAVTMDSGTWTASLVLSDPLPKAVLIRIQLADGSILESAPEDFVVQ